MTRHVEIKQILAQFAIDANYECYTISLASYCVLKREDEINNRTKQREG